MQGKVTQRHRAPAPNALHANALPGFGIKNIKKIKNQVFAYLFIIHCLLSGVGEDTRHVAQHLGKCPLHEAGAGMRVFVAEYFPNSQSQCQGKPSPAALPAAFPIKLIRQANVARSQPATSLPLHADLRWGDIYPSLYGSIYSQRWICAIFLDF